MDCVDIIMATYNGEKYLPEQIESLIKQSHTNWRLLISDDGSTDTTVAILNKYVKIDDRITVINITRQGGVVKNFSKALSFSNSQYVMFCDQDDIWFVDKVFNMLKALKLIEISQGKNTPILGFSDLCLVNENLSVIHKSFYEYNKLNPRNNLDYKYLSWRSAVYGCTVIFNKALLKKAVPLPDDIPMHDQWFALIAARFGIVYFLPESNIYYRQHSNNAVGGVGSGWLGKIISVNRLFLNTKKATLRCINQWNYMASGHWGLPTEKMKAITTWKEKIRFIYFCIFPYWKERKIYSFVFSILVLVK